MSEGTTDTTSSVVTRELEHYNEIKELNAELCRARIVHAEKKESASEAKKRCDTLAEELEDMIAHGPDMQAKLAFGDDEATEPKATQAMLAWRDVQVADALSLPVGQYDKLEDLGICTMGQLEDLRGGDGLASIKGFGQATVDRIEDKIIEWLSDNRYILDGEKASEDEGPPTDEDHDGDTDVDVDDENDEDGSLADL